jgi:hypothetical protein
MDRQNHPTTEEQTGNTLNVVPFDNAQNLEDYCKRTALLNKHQTYKFDVVLTVHRR